VMVEVEILEVNRTSSRSTASRSRPLPAGPASRARSSPPPPSRRRCATAAGNALFDRTRPITVHDDPYKTSNLLVTALPGVIYRLLQSDTSSRLLANPQLRTVEARPRRRASVTRCPCPSPRSRPIATGGVAQQP